MWTLEKKERILRKDEWMNLGRDHTLEIRVMIKRVQCEGVV